MHPSLTAPFPPFFHVVYGSRSDLAAALGSVDSAGGVALRTVRGGKMRTRREALDEMAAALQFPWYFGENWDALDECMQDLEWLGAKHVVIAVGDASELLADAPERDRETFAGVMKRAARERNGGAVLSLHAVLQVQTKPHSEKLAGWLGPLAPLGGA